MNGTCPHLASVSRVVMTLLPLPPRMFYRDRKKAPRDGARDTKFPTFQPPLPWITRSRGWATGYTTRRLTSVTSRSAQPQALRHVSSHSLRFRHVTILPKPFSGKRNREHKHAPEHRQQPVGVGPQGVIRLGRLTECSR